MTDFQPTKQGELARCHIGLHVYTPAYEVRQDLVPGEKEFRFECASCHCKTSWRPWRDFGKFFERHNPVWFHGNRPEASSLEVAPIAA